MRIGQGVDVHAFSDDITRPLVLGGVVVPDGPGLAGHSDADVVMHAVTDAILGAGALGDLGTLVGVDLPETAGGDSSGFLMLANDRLAEAGLSVINIDATVLAQRPRLAAHLPAMRQAVAAALGLDVGLVSIKATTTDRLGMLGRGEGIACQAVALVGRLSAGGG